MYCLPSSYLPPHTIISFPVQTAVCASRAWAAFMVLVAVQLSVPGLYRPPVCTTPFPIPPQTIISVPVHTAVCTKRASGALFVLVSIQLSVLGLYLPPVFSSPATPRPYPPQMIISLPVQTAVCENRATGVVGVAVHVSSVQPPATAEIAGST